MGHPAYLGGESAWCADASRKARPPGCDPSRREKEREEGRAAFIACILNKGVYWRETWNGRNEKREGGEGRMKGGRGGEGMMGSHDDRAMGRFKAN